jgi:DnaK suppressor protein
MPHHLTPAQRSELAVRIGELRRRAEARLAALEREHAAIVTGSADAVRDDEHDPEGATIAFERAQVAALRDAAAASVLELARVATKLDALGFGTCERCSLPIAYERLLARPTATRCTRCAA